MYNETITAPIRAELKTAGIQELTTATAVAEFFKTQQQGKTAAVLINSVCGCAARTARPGFYQSLTTTDVSIKPIHIASVFAGVDTEATAALREHLPGMAPSSPSLAFFRGGELVHFLGREAIEGADEPLLVQALALVYQKYFGKTVDAAVEVKDPFALLTMTPQELAEALKRKETALFDCRTGDEYTAGHIESATVMTETQAAAMLENKQHEEALTFYCEDGTQSLRAALYFRSNGFRTVRVLAGGLRAWRAAQLAIKTESAE